MLINGNFDMAPFETAGAISGWVVGGLGYISERQEGATTGSYGAVFGDGGDFQGDTLSQSFATVVGQTYTLDFDAGIAGVRSASPLQLRVQVIGSATLLDQTITPPEAGSFDPSLTAFQHYQFTFTANSTTTTLQFTDVGTGNAYADQIVDTVSIAPTSSPTPP